MSIRDEIKQRFIRLSRGQRKVAQFVIDNPNVLATHTASETGKLIGVSESTVIRFCYAMDLSGFSELQDLIKKDLMDVEGIRINEEYPFIPKQQVHSFNDTMNRDITSILNTIQRIDEEQFRQAVLHLHESKSIYVLGFRQSEPTANFLTSTLNYFGKNTIQVQYDVEHIVQQIRSIDEESLLIVIALGTIQEDAMTVVKLAKNKNAKVLAITNSSLSPIRDYSNNCFTIGAQKQASTEMLIASHSLIHALIEGMIAQNKKHYSTRQKLKVQPEFNLMFLDKTKTK